MKADLAEILQRQDKKTLISLIVSQREKLMKGKKEIVNLRKRVGVLEEKWKKSNEERDENNDVYINFNNEKK